MSDIDEEKRAEEPKKVSKSDGQVTLAQMLTVLDKDVASGVEKRLKKLSKKKGLKAVVNELEVQQLNRKAAYDETVQEISKWDPIVELNRGANLNFPLDVQQDHLPSTAESVSRLKPRNDLEREVQLIIEENMTEQAETRKKKKEEERYQKAISAEEAKERHLELQKTRVKLSEYAAKMRRQKKIKSKSYHRLLKRERIKKHLKTVESNQDALMDEIERLQKIRAQERATLKHKNTGKWAKHAKFRAKYDEEARRQMLEQIGIASKKLERPTMPESDSDDNDDDDTDESSEDSNYSSDESDQDESPRANVIVENQADKIEATDRMIRSNDSNKLKRKLQTHPEENIDFEKDDTDQLTDEDDDDEQRKLMSEAFANDDVVGEFEKAKDQIADEEQPKDVDMFLPGWNDWAGPGIEINERKRQKFIKKAPKIVRKDIRLNHVIISEHANASIRDMQPRQLPRGIKNDEQLKKVLSKPITSTFTDQANFRESIQPRITTKMGARIEPINKRILIGGGSKASWT